MALLWKRICNLGDPMSLRHPVVLTCTVSQCPVTSHGTLDKAPPLLQHTVKHCNTLHLLQHRTNHIKKWGLRSATGSVTGVYTYVYCEYIYIYMYVYTYIHTYIYIYINSYVCIYECIHIYAYITYIYIYIYVYM